MKRAVVGSTLLLAGLWAGCPTDPEPPDPLFPADYLTTYAEVRDCRSSGDHDLHRIRILADPAALAPYLDRVDPFPEGAVVLKEEYDFGDDHCSGDIKQWTVMVKLAEGASADTLGWTWQEVDASRAVRSENAPRCIGCHRPCGSPDGYDHTCAVP
jgi:hypothetical protein